MNKNKKLVVAFLILSATVAIWFAVAICFLFVKNQEISWLAFEQQLHNRNIWVVWGAAVVLGGMTLLVKINYSRRRNSVISSNELENSHWLTRTEIKHQKDMTACDISDLSYEKDGIVINAKSKLTGIDIVLAKPAHTLVVGTTGSGKTSAFISPNIQIMARTKTKPSMIISDIKGELFRQHSKLLQRQGYDIKVIDLGDGIYESNRWNPFTGIMRLLDEIKEIAQQFDELSDVDRLRLQQLHNDVFQDLQDVIYTAFPVEKSQDPMWQSGARDLIFAIAVGFAEDYLDGLITSDKFTLYSFYKNISMYCNEGVKEFKAYFEDRKVSSKAIGLANTVLVTQDRTLTSYLTDLNRYVQWLADTGVCSVTSASDISFENFDEKPTAVFIQLSDERQNRNKIASLFVLQMYKGLVAKSRKNEREKKTQEQTLLRNVYFLLDEFGNLPKIHNIDNIISVGRARKIWLVPVIQDYAQLSGKYGSELAAIIKSNCNIKVFIGSTDKGTLNEISELCGKTMVAAVSYSENSRDKEGMSSSNTSYSAREKPLIYPSELETLNKTGNWGNVIVLNFGHFPYRGKITPVFQCKRYLLGSADNIRKFNVFDERVFYNITHREALLHADDEQLQSKIEEMDKLKVVRNKISALKNKVPDNMYEAMIDALEAEDLEELIKLIDWAKDNAVNMHNNFMAFELSKFKVYLEELEKKRGEEHEKN